jgi:hypothetical protein
MGCNNPLTGYRSKNLNENGKRPIVWKEKDSDGEGPIQLPCGQCSECRLTYSRQWALRCYHESQLHEDNSFITLTYAPEHLPEDHSIHKEALQDFFKKLRYELDVLYGKSPTGEYYANGNPKYRPNKPIRYFACGEYGESNNRPHYHAIIFGFDFPDKQLHTKQNDNLLFKSELLQKCWPYGFSLIGNVTFQSAAYVARYVMKKRKGKPDYVDKHGKTNEEYYMLCDKETGEVHQLEPEFCIMSRRPGIGREWLTKYKGDTDKDYVTLATGGKYKIPKYYDSILEEIDPIGYLERKEKRLEKINPMDNTFERLRVKEKVKDAQIQMLKRGYENDT